jgi:hypothetical protein
MLFFLHDLRMINGQRFLDFQGLFWVLLKELALSTLNREYIIAVYTLIFFRLFFQLLMNWAVVMCWVITHTTIMMMGFGLVLSLFLLEKSAENEVP